MQHWTKSNIKGCSTVPVSFYEIWNNALLTGRYNESNWLTGEMTEGITVSQSTNKFMVLVMLMSAGKSSMSEALAVTTTMGDITTAANELTTNNALTITHSRGASTAPIVKQQGSQYRGILWGYDICTITPSTDTDADGVPLSQRIKLTINIVFEGKNKPLLLYPGRVFLKIIEIGQGYDGVQIPAYNEICPTQLATSFISIINGSLIGLDESIVYPRTKNYILGDFAGATDSTDVNFDNLYTSGSMMGRILKYGYSKEKDVASGVTSSYSVVQASAGIRSINGEVIGGENTSWFTPDLQSYLYASQKFSSAYYVERDLLIPQAFTTATNAKNVKIQKVSGIHTLMLKNQFPGRQSGENRTNDIWEFYKVIQSGLSTSRQQLDNVKLSIIQNTLMLPFYQRNNDVVCGGLMFEGRMKSLMYISAEAPFTLSYGVETSGAVEALYDIYDATHNVYIKILV